MDQHPTTAAEAAGERVRVDHPLLLLRAAGGDVAQPDRAPLGDGAGALQAGAGQDEGKLLAAIARRGIAVANGALAD